VLRLRATWTRSPFSIWVTVRLPKPQPTPLAASGLEPDHRLPSLALSTRPGDTPWLASQPLPYAATSNIATSYIITKQKGSVCYEGFRGISPFVCPPTHRPLYYLFKGSGCAFVHMPGRGAAPQPLLPVLIIDARRYAATHGEPRWRKATFGFHKTGDKQ
jgi:hypothetical protein